MSMSSSDVGGLLLVVFEMTNLEIAFIDLFLH